VGIINRYPASRQGVADFVQDDQQSFGVWENVVKWAAVAMVATDQNGRILFVNAAAERTFGYTCEELTSRAIELLMPESFRGRHAIDRRSCSTDPVACPTGPGRDLVALRKDGSQFPVEVGLGTVELGGTTTIIATIVDVSLRRTAEDERERLIAELQNALAHIKTLKGLLPICASCKKIRDDDGYWSQIESYLVEHSEATFSHSICPECSKKLYMDI
jgi:PAS domain S-box-containing protein